MRHATRYTTIWRAKGLVDDCKTISEMADRLEAAAKGLREMAAAGVALQQEVDDDYAFLETTDAKVASKFEMEKEQG